MSIGPSLHESAVHVPTAVMVLPWLILPAIIVFDRGWLKKLNNMSQRSLKRCFAALMLIMAPYIFLIFLSPLPSVVLLIMVSYPLLPLLMRGEGARLPLYKWAAVCGLMTVSMPTLFYNAIVNVRAVDWVLPAGWAVVAGLLFVYWQLFLLDALPLSLAKIKEKKGRQAKRLREAIAVGVLVLPFYSYGAVMFVNSYWDSSMPKSYRVEIVRKYSKRGRRGRMRHFLVIDSWGARSKEELSMSVGDYNSLNIGDFLCLDLYGGAIGVPYYKIKSCVGG